MKYIVLTIVIFIILLAKPWEINFAGGTPLRDDSTLLKANAAVSGFRLPFTPLETSSVTRILIFLKAIKSIVV